MKVMAFVGSPRKGGNTDILLDSFLEGAQSKGAETEKVYLYETEINLCQGCYKECFLEEGVCTRWDDEMNRVLERLIKSDLYIFGSPVYSGNFTSKMAAFFERLLPVAVYDVKERKPVKILVEGKKAVVAIVHGEEESFYADIPIKAMEGIIKQFGMEVVGKLYCNNVLDEGDIKKRKDVLKEAFDLGAKLCS